MTESLVTGGLREALAKRLEAHRAKEQQRAFEKIDVLFGNAFCTAAWRIYKLRRDDLKEFSDEELDELATFLFKRMRGSFRRFTKYPRRYALLQRLRGKDFVSHKIMRTHLSSCNDGICC